MQQKIKSIIVGSMNFSVILSKPRGYKSGTRNYEDYRNIILNPDRLKLREKIFFKHTAPLFIEKHNKLRERSIYLRLNIAVSDQLPEDLLGKFDCLEKEYKGIFNIIKVNEKVPHRWIDILNDQLVVLSDEFLLDDLDTVVFNFRLDDDDLLSVNYFDLVQKYLSASFEGLYVSFSSGFVGIYTNDFDKIFKINRPFLAIGLGKISKFSKSHQKITTPDASIMNMSHMRVSNEARVILDPTMPAFLWTMHKFSDTRSFDSGEKESNNKIERFVKDNNLVELDVSDIKEYFFGFDNFS